MQRKQLLVTTAILAIIAIAAIWRASRETTDAAAQSDTQPTGKNAGRSDSQPFHDQLLAVARTYEDYGRVDDETRWAPGLCRMPMPSMARFSQSDDDATHGQKLYYMFAKDRLAYRSVSGKRPQPIGQIVVKESWRPEEVNPQQSPSIGRDSVSATPSKNPQAAPLLGQGSYFPYARKGERLYRAHEKSGLYIMMKMDPTTPGTDAGWVYGTVTADGKTVTSAGRVESCMQCHTRETHDRMFGLPSSNDRSFPITSVEPPKKSAAGK